MASIPEDYYVKIKMTVFECTFSYETTFGYLIINSVLKEYYHRLI
jgi:hypothetical protein